MIPFTPLTASAAEATIIASGDCSADGSSVQWTLDDAGTLTISGTGATKDYEYTNSVPWQPTYNKDIQRFIIGEGVTEINRYYFCNFPNITSVTLPSTMKKIGLTAFANCESLESVTLNEGLETISMSAFRECVSLKTIHLPASLTQLDSRTFAGCTLSFTVDEANAVYSAVDGVLFNKDKTTLLQCKLSDTEYSVPQGVTSIEVDAFYECTALTNVEIPSSVTTIGNYAFSDCTSLTSIEIPSSVTIIGDYAFRRCTGLTSVKIPDSVTSINYAFHGCTGLTSIEIPSSVTSINGAFYDCTGLTSIEIPSSVTSMVGAFSGCTGLTSVKIPNGVTTIGSLAFEYCTGLTSIEIPNSVTTIGNYAFSDCTSLTSITIPHSVTSIESNAFDGCTKLTTVTTSCVPQFGWTDEDWETNVGHSVTLITEHTYENGVCTICDEPCGHTGGEATCTEKAVCTICGASYGELGGHSTTAEDDKAATCASKAYCSVCDSEYGEVDTTNHDSSVSFDSNGFCPNGCYQPAELKDGYYQIKNAGNLYWFAQQVNGGNGAINGKLTTNIVVNQNVLVDGALNSNTEGFRVWTPIGYWNSADDQSYYVGTFDGAGFTVSGLYLNDSTKLRIGLFGAVSTNGIVKNVGVVDSYFYGNDRVGGVVGYSNTSSTVQNCYNTGIVSGNDNVGGVVGYNNEGTVQNCYNMGTVSSNATTGGVVSLNWGGLVTNCHNTGTVKGGNETGGVVGYMISGYIEHCYNTGTVSGSKQTGGVLGCIRGISVKNCYNTGTVSGSQQIGGVVGYIGSSTVENCYNANSVSGSSSVGGVVGARYDSQTGTTTNCYFNSTKYSGSAIGGNDTGAATVEGKTTEQFASGEVAYLLGDAFGQNISSETYPVLGGTKVYYGYTSCGDTEKKYTNDENTSEEKPAHTGEATYTLTEDGKQHIANWSCCGTEVTEDHNGGTATCKEPAKCEHCGASYGELDPNNHEYEKNNGICCETYQPATLVTNENYASLGLSAEYVDYYAISNAGQLFWFAQQVNTVDRTASAVLTADIDLEKRPWTPIGSTGESSNNFRGVFDGQNHTIKGLYVEGGRAGLGFFGEVRTGTVKNFTIYGEVIVNTEVDYVGGVIGSICGLNSTDHGLERNGAVIQNITSYVNLTAKAHGVGKIGGFVGYANHQSLIENCSWYGTFDAGVYRVDNGAGGFIGRIQENTSEVTIRNCAAYGTIKTNYAGDYNNTATIYMGGFLSFSNTGAKTTIENCLFAGKFERGANLTDQAELAAFGTLNSVKSIKNCYYLGDDGLAAVHSESPLKPGENIEITSVTDEQLKSGEVAYKLQEGNEIWGQTINSQNYPVLGGDTVYYGYTSCDDDAVMVYTNDITASETKPDHLWGEGSLTRPTKTEDGYYTYNCSDCGKTKTEPAERATNYDEYTKALEDLRAYLDSDMLTDENKGYISEWLLTYDTDEAYSFIAGEEETVQMYIDATAQYVIDIETAIQGCLAGNHSGNGDYCEICGASLHTCDFSGEWKYDADKHWKECKCGLTSEEGTHTGGEATCTEKAVCKTCGESYGELDADNHDIVIDEAVVPKCEKTGLTAGQHCSRCDDMTIIQEVVPALNHKDTLVQVPAQTKTCNEIGWDAYEYCTECDYTTYKEIPASHNIVKVDAKPATCTESGYEAYEYCTECDYTTYKEIPASHNIVKVDAKAATCTEAGHEAYEYCTECDYTTYKEIPASHNIVKVDAKAATCTESGYEAYEYCTECDYTTYKEIPASHNIVKVDAKAATCTEAGHEAYEYCTECDYTTYKEIAVADHTKETVNGYAATCEKAGLTDGVKCSVCGKTITAQEIIEKLSHMDEDGDSLCDNGCGTLISSGGDGGTGESEVPDEPTDETCDHLCHKGGFIGLIWKIVQFFWKLFRMNPVCECGAAHY